MAKRENAQSFLVHYLPEEIKEFLEIEKLKIEKDSFVSAELEEYFSDMLYLVPLKDGREGHVYVLIEHKSYQEPWVALQILEYMVQCWRQVRMLHVQEKRDAHKKLKKIKKLQKKNNFCPEEWEKMQASIAKLEATSQKHFALPVVIPIVLYHGKYSWPYGKTSAKMFDCHEKFMQFIPHFSYILCDLVEKPEKDIKGIAPLQIMLRIFKFARTPGFEKNLEVIFSELGKDILDDNLVDIIQIITRYILSISQIETESLSQIMEKNLSHKGGQAMLTTAKKLELKGRKEGKKETLTKTIHRILQKRFGNIPENIQEKLSKVQDIDSLECILDKSLDAASYEEIF